LKFLLQFLLQHTGKYTFFLSIKPLVKISVECAKNLIFRTFSLPMNHLRCALIIGTCVWTVVARPQENAWSFRQCLDTALKRNIVIRQSVLTNELNKIALEQVKSSRIPSVSSGIGENLSYGWNIDPTTNQYVDQAYHSTNLSLSSNLVLFNGLQTTHTIRQNRLNIQAGGYDIEQARNDVTLNITMGYLQVLFAYEILSTARNQEQATMKQVDRTQKMMEAGKVPESSLFQVRSQWATDKLSVITAENQLSLSKVNLLQLMDVPVRDGFEVQRPVIGEPPQEPEQGNNEIYEKALTVQPQISGASLRTSASRMALQISRGARYPRLNLGASLSSNYASSRKKGGSVNPENYPFFEQIWNNLGQNVSLNLSIPIYSQRTIKSNIDRASINLLNTQLNEQNTRNQLRKVVEQAIADYRAAVKKYEAGKEQLSATELSYKAAEQKYNLGMLTATDFLIEKNNNYQAQSALLQAKYDCIFKNKILDFYQGRPIEFR
jgi:outer membrane protein